jgi:small subunit ribosomal protein S4
MSKYLGAKCRKCRRIGDKLMLKGERCLTSKCSIVKRNYPPGFHGPKGKGRQTSYGQQLNEKQKAKVVFNLLEKQFRLTFDKAQKIKGDTGSNFIMLLEMRLDNTIFRSGIACSRSEAREMVAHGHFTVNGRKVRIPSYKVKEGDLIEIYKNSRMLKPFASIDEKFKKAAPPSWLYIDEKEKRVKVLHQPRVEDHEKIVSPHVIVEFYSR